MPRSSARICAIASGVFAAGFHVGEANATSLPPSRTASVLAAPADAATAPAIEEIEALGSRGHVLREEACEGLDGAHGGADGAGLRLVWVTRGVIVASSAGNESVNVCMVFEVLAPGVQD